jgi:DNA-directed RNA polymerase specialized sigma24 family protein
VDRDAQSPHRNCCVSPVDRLGRRISPVVLEAAEEIRRRAIEHAEKLLIDPAVAAGLLEEAAAAVSRAIESKRARGESEVRNLPSYLFRAFIRRVNRGKSRQLTLKDAAVMGALGSDTPAHPQAALELKILVDELLTRSDPVTRDMFYRRLQGFSWKEIAAVYELSAHAAKSRFSQALRRISVRVGSKSDL